MPGVRRQTWKGQTSTFATKANDTCNKNYLVVGMTKSNWNTAEGTCTIKMKIYSACYLFFFLKKTNKLEVMADMICPL